MKEFFTGYTFIAKLVLDAHSPFDLVFSQNGNTNVIASFYYFHAHSGHYSFAYPAHLLLSNWVALDTRNTAEDNREKVSTEQACW